MVLEPKINKKRTKAYTGMMPCAVLVVERKIGSLQWCKMGLGAPLPPAGSGRACSGRAASGRAVSGQCSAQAALQRASVQERSIEVGKVGADRIWPGAGSAPGFTIPSRGTVANRSQASTSTKLRKPGLKALLLHLPRPGPGKPHQYLQKEIRTL